MGSGGRTGWGRLGDWRTLLFRMRARDLCSYCCRHHLRPKGTEGSRSWLNLPPSPIRENSKVFVFLFFLFILDLFGHLQGLVSQSQIQTPTFHPSHSRSPRTRDHLLLSTTIQLLPCTKSIRQSTQSVSSCSCRAPKSTRDQVPAPLCLLSNCPKVRGSSGDTVSTDCTF